MSNDHFIPVPLGRDLGSYATGSDFVGPRSTFIDRAPMGDVVEVYYRAAVFGLGAYRLPDGQTGYWYCQY